MNDLDREMAYTDWASSCRPHPDRDDVVCRRRPHEGDHAAGFGAGRKHWPNADDPRPDYPVLPIAARGDQGGRMSETCVCASQWIAAGGGCMCWPTTTRRETEPETDQPEEGDHA